jgi:predicted nucleic acid-binding protein
VRRVLLDTGPLVAFLNGRDRYHAWVKGRLASITPPLLTCEAVLSEACFLLRKTEGGGEAVLELLGRGLLAVPFRIEEEVSAVSKLLARYASVPMSFADACLVRMAEQHDATPVLTLDADFRVYRMRGRQVVPTVMP